MTPELRQKVLDFLNEARHKLVNGEYLLYDDKYALQAASLPDLTWSCEMEEQVYELMEENCAASPDWSTALFQQTFGYSTTMDYDAETVVDNLLSQHVLLTYLYYSQLTRHTIFIEPISMAGVHQLYAISDKAEHVACAIRTCSNSQGSETQYINCRISLTEELENFDEIYQVSPSANYIPPTSDVLCPMNTGQSWTMSIEQREAILAKINQVRSEISQGTYQLQNLFFALEPAQPLSPLLWSCDDEHLMFVEKFDLAFCSSIGDFFNPATEFMKTIEAPYISWTLENIMGWWMGLVDTNFGPNLDLNFLSQSSEYSTQYPAAFALSEHAESVACFLKWCPPTTWSETALYNFHFVCRAKPSLSFGETIYEVSATTPTTTTTTVSTPPPATTTTTAPQPNPCASGWFFYANACYRYVSGSTSRTQAQAEQWCVNQGKKGHLVSIHSAAEDNFVKSK
uniref:SCP domain-containing protein n=1 Tax=Panagrolaimus sp. ES5 TaxID=591445 RepID=A0AC34GUF7_9BILA